MEIIFLLCVCVFVSTCVCMLRLLTWLSACDRDGCGGLSSI